MALVHRDDGVGFETSDEHAPVLDKEEARQGDGARENLRVLDRSLPLAIVGLGIAGILVAMLVR
jgi:hypothetical protein